MCKGYTKRRTSIFIFPSKIVNYNNLYYVVQSKRKGVRESYTKLELT